MPDSPTSSLPADAAAFGASITVEMLDADPYPIYERMRRDVPVCWVPAVDLWFVTRWDDVQYVNTHPELFTAAVTGSPLARALGPNLLTVDGEVHKRMRGPVETPLKARAVDAWAAGIVTPIAERCFDAFAGRGRAELMDELLEPVSVLSLAQVLGLGDVDAATLRRWFFALATGGGNHEGDPAKDAVSDEAAAEIDARMQPIFDRLAREPDGSIVSSMLQAAGDDGEARERVLSNLKLILLGGMQEPGHGAGLTAWGVLSHPAARERLLGDPGLADAAVEEGMRWMSPVGTTTREVTREVELGGVRLPAGARIAAVIASANRDERRWPHPDVFDLDRPARAHRAFGTGPHFCVGHWLARYEQRIPLRMLFERLRNLRLDPEQPAEIVGWEFRGPRRLPVVWDV